MCLLLLFLLLLQWQAALGWLLCLSLMAVLVGLAYVLRETPAYPSVPHALYQGLHRPLWALAVTWIILACEEGYGGKQRPDGDFPETKHHIQNKQSTIKIILKFRKLNIRVFVSVAFRALVDQ